MNGYEVPRLFGLGIAKYPLKDTLEKWPGVDLILRRAVFDTLNRRRRDGGHRKICIAHAGPLHRSLVGEHRPVISVVSKAVIALVSSYVAVDRGDSLGLDVIEGVMIDRMIADRGADQQLCIRNDLAVPLDGNC